jgi:general secretion pathway protein K
MVDLQSRLNLTNLVQDGQIDASSLLAFTRLFKLLNLSVAELAGMAEQLRQAQGMSPNSGANAAPLMPQEVDQLVWVGLSPHSLAVLRPFITLLPVRTPVNLNTAPAEVIYACVEAYEIADAHRLVTTRSATHLATLADASKAGGLASAQFNDAQHSVASRFFEVSGNLQVAQTTVQEQSLVQRDGLEVKTLWRKRSVAPLAAPLQ